MQSPLLEGEDANGAPSLSSGPAVSEESEFSRLIAQQGPLEVLAERFEGGPSATTTGVSANYALLDGEISGIRNMRGSTALFVIPPRGPLTTAIAGTLAILHLVFVWSSYTSDIWAESRIRISVEWQEEFLPLLNDVKETVIRSTNLMSLLQDLGDSRSYLLMVLLWSVSLLLPCAFMIVSPTFLVNDAICPTFYAKRSRSWNGRGLIETLMRWAFLTFYIVVLLSLATSFMELQWTDTTIQVGTRARGSLAAYVMGIACSVGLSVLLRSPPSTNSLAQTPPAAATSQEHSIVRPPPPQAFQHPWTPETQEDEPTMTVLEEMSQEPSDRSSKHRNLPDSAPSTPELIPEDDGQDEEVQELTFRQKFLAFQLGLLSLILWIPCFYLPFLHLSYDGVATNFLTERVFKLYVWDIPFSHGTRFGTPTWIVVSAIIILLLTTLIFPILASCLGVIAWVGDGMMSTKCYSWLFALHPALCGPVFSIALFTMTHSLTPFSTSLLDHESSGLCHKFKEITGEVCLNVTAKTLPGLWFYFAQSLILELFILVTLRWC